MRAADVLRMVFGTRADPPTQEERDEVRRLFADKLEQLRLVLNDRLPPPPDGEPRCPP